MAQLPASFVDFSGALKKLFDSQEDVTKLVAIWDDIVNTENPQSFTITLSDGTIHQVDNIAKIRNDLIQGLSLDEPTVKAINFVAEKTKTSIRGSQMYSREWHGEGTDSFDDMEGWTGLYKSIRNDFRTACYPTSSEFSVPMNDMPRIVFLGAEYRANVDILDDVTITIVPPSIAYATDGFMVPGKQYTTLVTFVNRNFGTQATGYNYQGNPVVLTLKSGDYSTTVEIQPARCVTFLLFASAGANVVIFQELKANV